jgi:epoxyqueuosine reductase
MTCPVVRPKLLLHACCGVCSAYVPDLLRREYDVTMYYDNPNISPSEEFDRRAEAARAMAKAYGIPFILVPQEPVSWYRSVRGHAKDRENGERCRKCIVHRMDSAFRYAKANGFEIVATTLGVSRRKKVEMVNDAGRRLSEIHGIPYLDRDFRKSGGEEESQRRARESGIYRQTYCGCVYSKMGKS